MAHGEETTGHPVVHLHVGPPKSGTTHLQQRLSANRPTLAAHGVNWPGPKWDRQLKAAKSLIDWSPGSGGPPRAWDAMAASMLAHPGVSLLSMEFLFRATADQISHLVRSLAGAEIHVVLTLRDSTAVMPSQWQTWVSSGGTMPWRRYSRTLPLVTVLPPRITNLLPDASPVGSFTRRQSIQRPVDRWLRHIPAEHIHVVPVPPSREDPDLLWKRFAQAVSVSPDLAPLRPEFSRPSLGYASASLISRVNAQFGTVDSPAYRAVVRRFLCQEVLPARAGAEGRIPVSRAAYRAGLRQNARNRQAIERSGLSVVGDLDDLPTAPGPDHLATLPSRVAGPELSELLDAADLAVGALARRAAELGSHESAGTPEDDGTGVRIEDWRAEADPVQAATEAVCAAVRATMQARRASRTGSGGDAQDGPPDD